MTLATILSDIISDVPLAVPTSFIGNTDETALLAVAQAQRAGEALARKPQGGWVAMIRENDFVTAALQNLTGTVANTGPGGTAQITLSSQQPVQTWAPSIPLNQQNGNASGVSYRQEALAITRAGQYVRVTFSASTISGTYATAHCSVAKCNSATPPNTDGVPVELLFNGVSGFSIPAGGSIVSDWLLFPVSVGDNLMVVLDITSGGDQYQLGLSNGHSWFKSASSSYNLATVSGFGDNGSSIHAVALIETAASPMPFTWYAFGSGILNNSIVQSVSGSVITINQAASVSGSGTFTFGQSDYPVPADFQRVLDNTMWDRSRFWSMRGPQSPQQWQLYKSSVIGRATIQRRFRFREVNGNQVFSIDPVPTDNGAALVWEYVSNGWCKSAAGAPQTRWQADTDVGVLDEYLLTLGTRWRMLRRLGMSYSEELDEYEREVSRALATDGGAAILSLVPVDNNLTPIGPWNLPETNFGGVTG